MEEQNKYLTLKKKTMLVFHPIKLKKKIKAKDALEQMEDLLKFMRDRDCLANMKKV